MNPVDRNRSGITQPIHFSPGIKGTLRQPAPTAGYRFTALPPLSLYIHMPWCIRKCPYCDFNSHETVTLSIAETTAYIDALIQDLEQELPSVWGRTIDSIFIGGGTPSLFPPEAIDQLLSRVRARLPLRPGLEITMEANPGSCERGQIRGYREAGINRLSLGVQSLDAEQLKQLGRIHDPTEARTACQDAGKAGFASWNIDLMFGLPGQDTAAALDDLQQAINLEANHISFYQLTIEPNTAFHHSPPTLPEEDMLWNIQTQGQQQLREAGYVQYEVSAYARLRQQCQHNLNYWRFGDYIGIGAGAHGKISRANEQHIQRYAKLRHPQAYLRHAGSPAAIGSQHRPAPRDTLFEFMLNALRLNEGFTLAQFHHHTGIPDSKPIEDALQKANTRGLICYDGNHIRASNLGKRYLNDLIALFLPE